jgi:hypothetical protein
MLSAIFWILVGAFVGWNLPQPEWAKRVEEKVKNFFATRWG